MLLSATTGSELARADARSSARGHLLGSRRTSTQFSSQASSMSTGRLPGVRAALRLSSCLRWQARQGRFAASTCLTRDEPSGDIFAGRYATGTPGRPHGTGRVTRRSPELASEHVLCVCPCPDDPHVPGLANARNEGVAGSSPAVGSKKRPGNGPFFRLSLPDESGIRTLEAMRIPIRIPLAAGIGATTRSRPCAPSPRAVRPLHHRAWPARVRSRRSPPCKTSTADSSTRPTSSCAPPRKRSARNFRRRLRRRVYLRAMAALGHAPPTLGRLREALADARADGLPFDEAWPALAPEFLDADVREATAEAWQRAYDRGRGRHRHDGVATLARLETRPEDGRPCRHASRVR